MIHIRWLEYNKSFIGAGAGIFIPVLVSGCKKIQMQFSEAPKLIILSPKEQLWCLDLFPLCAACFMPLEYVSSSDILLLRPWAGIVSATETNSSHKEDSSSWH